jgi:hypothetical protein
MHPAEQKQGRGKAQLRGTLRNQWGTFAHRACTSIALLLMLAAPVSAFNDVDYQQTLLQDNRTLEINISREFTAAQRENLVTWIDFISGSLRQVYGHWPRQQWRVIVMPASASPNDPIPWAQVKRDGIDRVEFFTAPQATSEQLIQSWTGYHELAHLLIPYRGWGDTWFSEGLATYYQGLLQARAGVMTEQQAWQSLLDGFMRAQADSQFDGQSLRDVSAAMRKKGGFMRVYWSGAWYFLALDIRLRQQSGGKHNLDLALRKLNDCCADQHLSVRQMVTKLDELNGVLLFEQLYDKVDSSTRIPDADTLFASVGVTVVDSVVALQEEGPGASLRKQMTQPKVL